MEFTYSSSLGNEVATAPDDYACLVLSAQDVNSVMLVKTKDLIKVEREPDDMLSPTRLVPFASATPIRRLGPVTALKQPPHPVHQMFERTDTLSIGFTNVYPSLYKEGKYLCPSE